MTSSKTCGTRSCPRKCCSFQLSTVLFTLHAACRDIFQARTPQRYRSVAPHCGTFSAAVAVTMRNVHYVVAAVAVTALAVVYATEAGWFQEGGGPQHTGVSPFTITTGGHPQWTYDTGSSVSGGMTISADGSYAYVGAGDGYLYCLSVNTVDSGGDDISTGFGDGASSKWSVDLGGTVTVSPTLSADGSQVFVGYVDSHIAGVQWWCLVLLTTLVLIRQLWRLEVLLYRCIQRRNHLADRGVRRSVFQRHAWLGPAVFRNRCFLPVRCGSSYGGGIVELPCQGRNHRSTDPVVRQQVPVRRTLCSWVGSCV